MSSVPQEVIDFKLLTWLKGYTLKDLNAEHVQTVQRWLVIIEELEAERARIAKQLEQKAKHGG